MKQWMLTVLVALVATGVFADKAGVKVAELTAGGDAKEVAVDQPVSKVVIKCIEGSVIINTVVVRNGGESTPHKVGARINKDEVQQITVGNRVPCTGLRISDDGNGKYVVRVKKE